MHHIRDLVIAISPMVHFYSCEHPKADLDILAVFAQVVSISKVLYGGPHHSNDQNPKQCPQGWRNHKSNHNQHQHKRTISTVAQYNESSQVE